MTNTTLLAMLLPCLGFSQQLTFDAVSIKQANPDLRQGVTFKPLPGGRFVATMCTLGQLIEVAYGIERYQRKGGPDWIDEARFDIVATPPPEGGGDDDEVMISGRSWPKKMTLMLQSMLADRFRVKAHWETRQEDVLLLSVAKGGPKFKEAPPDDERPLVTLNRQGPGYLPATTYIIKGHRASMYLLTVELSQHFNKPVIDNTGLSATYNFEFEYGADEFNLETGPSIFGALQKQAGLKLTAGKGPVKVLVLDGAERPTAN